MIITRIVFDNFALYAGKQEVVLTPHAKRPVTVVGGLNGAGKTSFLEGIQIALFGSNAPFLKAEKRKYTSYLRSAVHAGKSKASEAQLTLEFTLKGSDGDEQYVVDRKWELTGSNSANEELTITVNGHFDRMLTDVWPEYVENIVPPRLAPLFFFDGEQVERYAKPEATSQVLSIGLKALLGLDLIDQTNRDAATLRGQQRRKIKGDNNVQPVDETLAVIKDLEAEKSRCVQEAGSLQNQLFQAQKILAKVEQALQRRGGDLYEQRELINEKHQVLKSDLLEIRTQLRELAAEDLPLSLIRPLLEQANEQATAEDSAKNSRLLLKVLDERDRKLLEVLEEGSPESVQTARAFVAEDIALRRREVDDVDTYLGLSTSAQASLTGVVKDDLNRAKGRLDSILEQLEATEFDRAHLIKQMEMIPDEATIGDLLRRRSVAEKELVEIKRQIDRNQERIASFEYNLARTKSRFDKMLREQLAKDTEALEANRVVEFSFLVQEKLKAFKKSLTKKYISTIEKEILGSFNQLCRKEAFVNTVEINADSLELMLIDSGGESINPDKLSAGERQLLVISILWGLARAANSPIPFVIDTPLGRLDSTHREKLIRNFFSVAGHQVVLLSTDEEIDSRWKKELEPAISHSYLLEYDHIERSTKISKGYFGGAA